MKCQERNLQYEILSEVDPGQINQEDSNTVDTQNSMQLIFLILSTITVATLIAIAFYALQKGAITVPLAPQQSTLLITGPSQSGKTALFQSLLYNNLDTPTHTSQRPNTGTLILDSGKKVKVVDVPGHPRLSTYDRPATAVIFTCDASTIQKSSNAVAQTLLRTLSTHKRAEVIIFGNKSDFFTALSVDKLTGLIDAEINKIKASRSGRLDTMTEEDPDEWLDDIEVFRIADHARIVTGSVTKNKIADLKTWIEEIM